MDNYDCIELFNNIIHDKKDNIVKDIFENIMLDFDQYVILRDIVKKGMKVNAKLKNKAIHFLIEVDKKSIYKKILNMDNTEIKKKKKVYTITVNETDEHDRLDIYFTKLK